jgi:hypothetical protein
MKTENSVAMKKLSSLRIRVENSENANDKAAAEVKKEAMEENGKLKLADKIEIAAYEGAALADFLTLKMIERMILELAAE